MLDGIIGAVDLHAVSAEVSVRSHQGDLTVQTVSGDVTASGTIGRFSCDGVSADVVVDLTGTPDRITHSSVSGDLTVRLDAGVPAQYSINTLSGRLQLDDSSITGIKGRYTGRYGQLAGSFTEVRANSVTGDISVVHTVRDGASASTDSAEASA